SARHADLIQHQATREFRRCYELRDLSDVFRFLCSLPLVAGAGRKSNPVLCVPVQSIHPCGRTDAVRAVRANELDFPGSSQQLHSNFHDRRRVRLRSVARPQPPRARWRRDMRLLAAFCVLLAVAGGVDRSLAADPRYPDWPCVQAKVPEVSLAAVWTGPVLDDAASKWKDNAKVGALIHRLAARRMPLDEAEKMIAEFLSGSAAQKKDTGKLLFAGLFDTLNAQRSSVMNGLERVTRKQREAADRIRSDTLALQALQDASPPDQAKIEEFGNQLVWETRIFEDRRRVIKFVCEV